MFSVIKGISDLVFGTETNSIVQIPSGQLYYKNPTDFHNPQTLIFPDCAATIIRTTNPFNFQFVISKIIEEGSEELEEENEKTFLVDSSLRFKKSTTDENQSCFVWMDVDDDSRICTWEYVLDMKYTSQTTVDFFEETMYRCMFQRKYSKKGQEVSQNELNDFISSLKSMYNAPLESIGLVTPIKKSENSIQNSPSTPNTFKKTYLASLVNGECLSKVQVELYLYDMRFDQFVRQLEHSTMSIVKLNAKYSYALVIMDEKDQPFISQLIDSRMTPTFNREHRSFVWNWFDIPSGQGPFSWSVKFICSSDSENEFKRIFSLSIYETLQQEEFKKVNMKDQEWLTAAYDEDVDMGDAFDLQENELDEEEEYEEEEKENTRIKNTTLPDSDDEGDDFKKTVESDHEINSNLTVGYKYDRSYVLRGNKMGVFNHGNDDLKFQTMITPIKTLNGKEFTPSKVMLHEQDSAMLLMNDNDDKTIYKMDLNRGSVVEGKFLSFIFLKL